MSRSSVVLCCVALCCVMGLALASSSSTQLFCPDLKPQRSLDLDQLMGMWYAVEIVLHHNQPEKNAASQHMYICPVLHLARVSSDHLRLLWDEKAGLLEYNFKTPVKDSPGFWLATGRQNGSLNEPHQIPHFSGTAQVMKAVGSHMVLTLCSRPEHQVMTVVMAREMHMDKLEIISVNNMLERRGLAMSMIKETCRSAAILNTTVNYLLLSGAVLLAVSARTR